MYNFENEYTRIFRELIHGAEMFQRIWVFPPQGIWVYDHTLIVMVVFGVLPLRLHGGRGKELSLGPIWLNWGCHGMM